MRFPWERKESSENIRETKFPDNSMKVGIIDYQIKNPHIVSLRDTEDIWKLLLYNDVLVRNNISTKLRINYLMYQQDDRIFNEKESFGLRVLADVLNSLKGFHKVEVFDPHSDVVNLIKDVSVITAEKTILNVLMNIGLEDLCVLTPDAGAYKKYIPQIPKNIPVYTCSKVRDSNGAVKIVVPEGIKENKILIVDDIGLGCNTHLSLAQSLQEDKEKFLYVSHGVFNQGVEHLKPHFKKVFTTNSITTEKETKFLKIIKL